MLIAVFFAMLMILTLPFNVFALSNTYEIDFETCLADAPITYTQTTYLMTQKKTGYVNASSSVPKTGFTDMGIYSIGGIGGSGWINLSYDKSLYLTSFRMWLRSTYSVASTEFYMIMYNKTTQWSKLSSALSPNTTNGILTFMVTYSGSNIGYAVSTNYVTGAKWSIYNQVNISLTDTLGHGTLWRNGSSPVTFTCSNTTAINNNCRIDSIYFYATDWHAVDYIDDMNLTLSDSYSSGTISGCSDFTGYYPTGRFAYGSTDVDSIHISTLYNVPVTTTIHGVELQISENQYDSDSDVSHYGCSINGLNIGTAKCIFSESYYYVVQWEANMPITDQTINFDFSHTQLISGTQYWDVGCGVSSSDDVNGDGEVGFYWQDDSVVYHWEWYYWVYMLRPTYGAGTTFFNRDLGMRFWSTGFATAETYDYVDTLGLANYYSYNTTGYIYDLTQGYENVMGAYTLGNPSSAYTLNLYVNNTKVLQYGFPINCRYPGSGFGFSPNSIGKYRIQMNTTHAVANVTAWVTGARPMYSIRTNPVISDQFMSYSVSAYYNNPQGYTGGVAMDNYKQMLNTFSKTMYQRYPIQNNMTTTFSHQSNNSIPEYWGLYTNVNGLYNKVADATHYIRIPSIYENEIHTTNNNYPCPANKINELSISVEGTHIFPGADVRLYANSIEFAKVGDSQNFIQQFTPKKFGAFNISMYLIQNGTTKMLAQCNFTVSPSDLPGVEDETNPMISFIPEEYYIYIAIGIIIGFMFAPIFFVYTMKTEFSKVNITLEVPTMITMVLSIMMGIVAFILDVMWGLLEWWTVFFFIFVLVLIIVIIWLKGGSTA